MRLQGGAAVLTPLMLELGVQPQVGHCTPAATPLLAQCMPA
jgi:hypothetical protein